MRDFAPLATIEPRSAESRRLRELIAAVEDTRSRLRQVDVNERETHADARQAAELVSRLQRDAALGTDVTAAEIRSAEKKLAEARARASQPFSERRSGMAQAVRAAEGRVQAHVAAQFEQLVAEVGEDAHVAADRVNRAADDFMSAYHARIAVERQLIGLVAQLVTVMKPNAVTSSKADPVAQAIEEFVTAGGDDPARIRPEALPQNAEVTA